MKKLQFWKANLLKIFIKLIPSGLYLEAKNLAKYAPTLLVLGIDSGYTDSTNDLLNNS